MNQAYTNNLINETSPYLLQHAYNPVDWNPWNETALAQAKKENKLLLISVGYAACHWCHVMEHESFEDTIVAELMNSKFVNIKVDREERPDIDQVYMNAVQLMTGNGGWPMNVVALPDGRPVWGGTYFRKEQWLSALEQISDLYRKNPEKLYEYADKLEQGIKAMDVVTLNKDEAEFSTEFINNTVKNWSQYFDHQFGGLKRAPKFMMPNNYHFLLRYGYQNKHPEILKFVNLTLTQMAYGGLYDQVGGGFSRYSTDVNWHIPHFEKMLYDNAQLVSLYSDAYLITKNKLYKDVVYETLKFVERELTAENGAFYSSLDADSNTPEGHLEEGAFYVWNKEELQSLLASDFKVFSDYYNISDYGFWENNHYVLIRKETDEQIINTHNISIEILNEKKRKWKDLLIRTREKRSRPRLDDKTLTSWNALMIKGYVDAYRVFGEKSFLKSAEKNAQFILNNQLREDGGLNHNYKNNKSTINGYLEDYAATIEAYIVLYENTLNDKWLLTARDLTNYVFDYFYEETNSMFYFTSNEDPLLVSRTIEYRDNVIPASNSIMSKNLFKLSRYFDNSYYYETATKMLNNIKPEIQEYGSNYSNYLDLMMNYTHPFYEVAVSGTEAKNKIEELNQVYLPNKILAGSTEESNLPLLKNRFLENETLIYVCVNHACKLPVKDSKKAIEQLKSK
ncbi:thioredoxin domain-containing protein [Xanthomarina sp. F2636L]|uniref:thioredoxin domain-containing protein n=1 Tax=Xanthomarina sp. F2636L TaxID=2996018 RepID=UPI00225E0175|nr:thioredoxin domain-containing protein [Xanthomarina sp. F2636L]MCX7551682.1 thioredoxin domain-containing protein [Xanthomarina sp. F2636L]